jgi:hypothetical protein
VLQTFIGAFDNQNSPILAGNKPVERVYFNLVRLVAGETYRYRLSEYESVGHALKVSLVSYARAAKYSIVEMSLFDPALCLLDLSPPRRSKPEDPATVGLGTSEHHLVDLAIGILGHHRSSRAVGSHGATTVADGEIATGKTVFVLNQVFWSLDKVAPRSACLEHSREVGFTEDVAEEIFRVTGDPAVALGD